MLDDAADIINGEFRQPRIAIAGEKILAVLRQRLVHVHAGAIIADDGLGHECRGLAVGVRHAPDCVLEDLHPVGALHQAVVQGADFVLPRGRHFVMVYFAYDALLFHCEHHGIANVMQGIGRRHRKVASLHRRAMPRVAAFEFLAGRPRRFFGFDFDEAAGHIHVPGHRIKNEELGLRSEISGISNTRGFEIGLAALGNRARIAVISLAIGRLNHVAGDIENRLIRKWVHAHGVRVGQQHHVGGFNAFPSGN